MRAHGDETHGLGAVAALEHAYDRPEVVVTDATGHSAEVVQCEDVALERPRGRPP